MPPSQKNVTLRTAQGTKGRQGLRQEAPLPLAPLSKGVSRAGKEARVSGYSLPDVTKSSEVISMEHVNERNNSVLL